jgi:DNA-binding MarR family transcriptional regulator
LPVATVLDADREIAQALIGLMPLMGRLAHGVARERGTLTLERSKILWPLVLGGPMRAGELAQQCHLGRPTLTELVDGLVDDGLVRRDEDPSDRRAVILALTAQGRRELHRFETAIAAALAEVVGRLEQSKRERLRATLADLHRAFREQSQALEVANVR